MIGLTNYTTKAHICRAAIEAVCFRSKEVGYYTASTVELLWRIIEYSLILPSVTTLKPDSLFITTHMDFQIFYID